MTLMTALAFVALGIVASIFFVVAFVNRFHIAIGACPSWDDVDDDLGSSVPMVCLHFPVDVHVLRGEVHWCSSCGAARLIGTDDDWTPCRSRFSPPEKMET